MARNKKRDYRDYYRAYFDKRQVFITLCKQIYKATGNLPQEYLKLLNEPDWQDNKHVQKMLKKAGEIWRMR